MSYLNAQTKLNSRSSISDVGIGVPRLIISWDASNLLYFTIFCFISFLNVQGTHSAFSKLQARQRSPISALSRLEIIPLHAVPSASSTLIIIEPFSCVSDISFSLMSSSKKKQVTLNRFFKPKQIQSSPLAPKDPIKVSAPAPALDSDEDIKPVSTD